MAVTLDATTINGTLRVTGTINGAMLSTAEELVGRGNLKNDTTQEIALPLTEWRVWNAFETALGTAATDDLGISAGAFGTGCPYITAGDLKAAGATTRYARMFWQIPLEYVADEVAQLRFSAGMLTTVSDTTCTLDAEVYLAAEDTLKTGSDLVTTAATTMNSTTFANVDFTLTDTALTPGGWLDIRIAIACNDAATGTAVEPAIALAQAMLTVRG